MTLYLRIAACVCALALTVGAGHAAYGPSAEQRTEGLVLRTAQAEPVRLAQAGDATYRIGQLEERLRVLNGRIEELSFQLLEMQEQMRKMQEDNEFRFQELEGGATGSRTDTGSVVRDGNQRAAVTEPTDGQSGNTLGTITFDQNGEIITSGQQDTTQTASLPPSSSEELYRASYGYVLSGDYGLAETGFRNYIEQYPQSQRLSDAYFWLGEAQYSQGQYHEAAKTLLSAHKQFPNAQKSPEMLLKLGMALAALDNRDTACATYREVLTRYPEANDAVKAKVAVEQSRMSC